MEGEVAATRAGATPRDGAVVKVGVSGNAAAATAASERLAQLWQLFSAYGGSIRVVAAIAEQLQLTADNCLPLPLQGLNVVQRERVAEVLKELRLDR